MNNALSAGILLSAVACFLPADMAAYAAGQSRELIRSEVTKRDSRGRVQVMEVRAGGGSCVAEVVYEDLPRIYVVVISRARLQNLGYLQINDGTKDNLTDEVLMENFEKTIGEHCLPLIVRGYAQT